MSQTNKMIKQDSGKNCSGCRYWYPLPALSGESNQAGWCHRPITYFVEGKNYANGLFPKTEEGMSCSEWKQKVDGEF